VHNVGGKTTESEVLALLGWVDGAPQRLED